MPRSSLLAALTSLVVVTAVVSTHSIDCIDDIGTLPYPKSETPLGGFSLYPVRNTALSKGDKVREGGGGPETAFD